MSPPRETRRARRPSRLTFHAHHGAHSDLHYVVDCIVVVIALYGKAINSILFDYPKKRVAYASVLNNERYNGDNELGRFSLWEPRVALVCIRKERKQKIFFYVPYLYYR